MLTGTLTFVPTSTSTSYPNRFWMSDEYGPYIYKFSSSGSLVQAIEPPAAILPPGQKGECEFYVGGGPEDWEVREPGCVPLLSQASILYYLGHTFIRATQPLFFILAI